MGLWHAEARQLCESPYQKLLAASEHFLQAHVQTSDGPLVKTSRAVVRRLAGTMPLRLAA